MATSVARKMRNFLLYTAYILLVSFISLEFLLIFLDPYLSSGFEEYDPDLGFRVRPYANGTNQFGFNDRDYPLERAPGTYRILVVGDSFGWAGGLDGNYTALLEGRFADRFGPGRVEVVNSGYGGTHTAEQLRMLRKYGLQYKPDLVFLGFFVGNDFADANPNRKRIVVNATRLDIDKRDELTLFGRPIVPTSRLYGFLRQRYVVWREMLQGRGDQQSGPRAEENAESGTFSEETFLTVERVRLELFNRRKHESGDFSRNVDYILGALTEMKALLDAKGIEFHVGIYPDEFQVSEPLRDQLFKRYELRRDDYDMRILQQILRDHLEAHSIPYLDLTLNFIAQGRTRVLYKLRDTHWNEEGNELAAELVYRYLLPNVERVCSSQPSYSELGG